MTIDIRNIQSRQTSSAGTAPAPRDGHDETTSPRTGDRASAGADRVALSETAQSLKGLAETAAASSEIDAGKVERIRAQIAEGRYHVDPAKLAGRMLDLERELLG